MIEKDEEEINSDAEKIEVSDEYNDLKSVQEVQDFAGQKKEITEKEESEEADDEKDNQTSDLRDQLLRSMAENENIRRRSKKELEDTSRYAIAGFARDLLSVADNLRRALDSTEVEQNDSSAAFKALLEGVELTEKEFLSMLTRYGIHKITPKGERFDAKFHQAMFEVESTSEEPGSIVEVIQPGYVIGDRLLRPAMVGVAKKPVEAQESSYATASGREIDTEA